MAPPGVAPALLAYLWALTPYGRYGWLAAFLYVAATALAPRPLQLADRAASLSHDFTGLPCPAAAGVIATAVMFSSNVFNTTTSTAWAPSLALIYLLSYLMVSTHRYVSFKHLDIPREKRFQLFIGLILLLILLASDPAETLFPAIFLYTLSGPVLALA